AADRVRAASLVERADAGVADALVRAVGERKGAVAEGVGAAAAGLIPEGQGTAVDRVRAAVLVERPVAVVADVLASAVGECKGAVAEKIAADRAGVVAKEQTVGARDV